MPFSLFLEIKASWEEWWTYDGISGELQYEAEGHNNPSELLLY